MEKANKKVSWQIIRSFLISIIAVLLFCIVYATYRIKVFSEISVEVQKDYKKYIDTILILFVFFIIQRLAVAALAWYKERVASRTKTEFDDKLIPVLRIVLKIVIWVIALFMILPLYGIDIRALIATLGVGSLAIALAAQDTVANIIAGFLIMLDTPFRIGDKIKLPSGEIVSVLDIGIRRSKFISEDKTAIIIVPNLDLSKSKIMNYTYAEGKGKER